MADFSFCSCRRQLPLAALLLSALAARAQTGGVRIGTAGTPDASAVLDVASSSKGLLLPRVASAAAIASPAAGLLVYQTNSPAGFYCYSGGQWQQMAAGSAAAVGPTVGDIKQGLQTADHAGWVKLDGRAVATLTSTQQSRATALGIGSNLPDATGKVLKQTSGSLLGTGGSNAATIAQANLPSLDLTGATSSGGSHNHFMWSGNNTGRTGNYYDYAPGTRTGARADYYTSYSGDHSHTVTVPLGGSGTALPVEDAYLGVNQFVYLGQ